MSKGKLSNPIPSVHSFMVTSYRLVPKVWLELDWVIYNPTSILLSITTVLNNQVRIEVVKGLNFLKKLSKTNLNNRVETSKTIHMVSVF